LRRAKEGLEVRKKELKRFWNKALKKKSIDLQKREEEAVRKREKLRRKLSAVRKEKEERLRENKTQNEV
jgi:hypothetical protein